MDLARHPTSCKLVNVGNGWCVLIRARLSPSHDLKTVTYEWHLFNPNMSEIEEGTHNMEKWALIFACEAKNERLAAIAEVRRF